MPTTMRLFVEKMPEADIINIYFLEGQTKFRPLVSDNFGTNDSIILRFNCSIIYIIDVSYILELEFGNFRILCEKHSSSV